MVRWQMLGWMGRLSADRGMRGDAPILGVKEANAEV